MSERPPASPFAPPRAGRSAAFWRVWFASRRKIGLANRNRTTADEMLQLPWIAIVACCVPLFGLTFSPHRLLRLLAPPLFAVSLVLAFAEYGERLGGVAFGLVIAIHAAGIGAYVQAVSPASNPFYRVARQTGIALVLILIGLILTPYVMSALVIRVPGGDGILLVNPLSHDSPYRHGEPMAFLIQSYDGTFELPLVDDEPDTERPPDLIQRNILIAPGVAIRTGLYLGQVIAAPGDRIAFTKGFFSVNDSPPRRALPLMPVQGEIQVPATRVLLWPDLSIRLPAAAAAAHLPPTGLLLRKSALVGRPYKRWFWRTFTP